MYRFRYRFYWWRRIKARLLIIINWKLIININIKSISVRQIKLIYESLVKLLITIVWRIKKSILKLNLNRIIWKIKWIKII